MSEMKIGNSLLQFLKKEPVLMISAVLAAVSMAAVPPSAAYLAYIDVRVLCLLFCLMGVVAAFQECGLFTVLAQKLLAGEKSFRMVSIMLVMLPFFTSMLVTNDVALITFVPFAVLVLELAGRQKELIRVVVLQTVAANLGSMATPVGNPQNLYLYARYHLGAGEFFGLLLPLVFVSFLLLFVAAAWGGKESIQVSFPEKAVVIGRKRLLAFGGLFVLCLLSVFHVVHYLVLTAVVIVVLGAISPKLLRQVDYGLLITFVFFFIFSGNLGQMPAVYDVLASMLEKNTLLCSAAVSQLISNVPAAVLLSGLTEDWKGLLAGVDVGGLGTPVASLASLISMKFYMRTENRNMSRYMLYFTVVNVVGLVILLPLAAGLIA